MKMRINSSKDIIKCRDILLKKLKIQKEKLKIARNKNSKDQDKYVENIRQINISLQKLDNLLIKTAKFKTSEFASFMTKFLVLTEGDFVLNELEVEDWHFDYTKAKKNKYFIISDKASSEHISNNIRNEVELTYFLDFSAGPDVTFLSGDTTYLFTLNLDIKNQFSRYPRLVDAIYSLIDLKLANEEITDKERFNAVLEDTINSNLVRSNKLAKTIN